MKPTTYAIVGGGIAGLTTAIALQQIGMHVQLFEAAAEIKPVGAGLGLGTNAVKALASLGLGPEVHEIGQPMKQFSMLTETGKIITHSGLMTTDGRSNLAVHRAELHALLLSKLKPGSFHTGKRVHRLEQHPAYIELHFEDGSQFESDYLVVADGIHSNIRKQLVPDCKIRYAGHCSWRGVAHGIDTTNWEPTESWGKNGRFGMIPLKNNRVYWFACVNAAYGDERFKNYGIENLRQQFKNYHSPIDLVLQHTASDKLIFSPIQDLQPLSRFAYDRVVLIGDAAHATTPNLAQGACQAIEDAVVLANCLKKQSDTVVAFQKFEQHRIKRTHWIVNTSWQLGKIAQLENPLLIQMRNLLLKVMPDAASRRQFQKLETVDLG